MGVKPLHITKDDLQPAYHGQAVDADGVGVDITGATIKTTMAPVGGGTAKINQQTVGIEILDQTTNKGDFKYWWQAGETDTSGAYDIEFEVNPVNGKKFTLRGGTVIMHPSLDNT